jgi:hypothetical protein
VTPTDTRDYWPVERCYCGPDSHEGHEPISEGWYENGCCCDAVCSNSCPCHYDPREPDPEL